MSKFAGSRSRSLTLLLLFSFLAAPASFASPQGRAQNPQSPRPLPPTQYIPNHDFDTRHIVLNLHFDWEQQQAIGTETITIVPLVKDLGKIELDAADMTFSSVKLVSGLTLSIRPTRTTSFGWVGSYLST
jgi:hypothetical protein